MKTKHHKASVATMQRTALFVLTSIALTGLPSCSQEDAALQVQLVETRSALDAKSKALEKAEADLAKAQNRSGTSVSSEEVAKIKARNSELEDQLAAVRAQASESGGSPKFDMDAMAAKLEDDLTVKAKQLRELIQKQATTGKVDEISLKAITYPSEIVTPFSSSITFSMIMDGGKNLRLMFPVTADLGGVWKLPTAGDVQKAFEQAQTQPQQVAAAPAATVNGAGGSFPPAPATAAPAASGGASMRQVDGNTFAFNWGDTPAGASAAPAQPRQAAPAPAAAYALQQAAAPAAAPQPAAPASVPAAVMPVQRDVVIKFD